MKSEAIRCAIKLSNEPALLARFGDRQRRLPRGITELLRIVSSDAALKQISKKNNIDAIRLREILLNYIQKVLFQDNNSDLRKLGLDQSADASLSRLHYRLLMNIFHPDKFTATSTSHQYTQLISKAYRNIKNNQAIANEVVDTPQFTVSTIYLDDSQQISNKIRSFFLQSNKDEFVRKNWLVPVFSIFLIGVFMMFFVIVPSSPKIVVKKTNNFTQDVANKEINLQEEKRHSSIDIINPQQLSNNARLLDIK
jgi:hypothetical protein